MRKKVVEQRIRRFAEKPLRSGRAVRTTDEVVVHRSQRGEPPIAEAVSSVMVQGQLSIGSFHAGAAALEQVSTRAGHGFDVAYCRCVEFAERGTVLA